MLTLWRRHNPAKCTLTKRTDKKCRCIIWMSGTLPTGEKIRESTQLRDWSRAEIIVRRREVEGTVHQITRATLVELRDNFMHDARNGRNLSNETIRKYVLLFKQLEAF